MEAYGRDVIWRGIDPKLEAQKFCAKPAPPRPAPNIDQTKNKKPGGSNASANVIQLTDTYHGLQLQEERERERETSQIFHKLTPRPLCSRTWPPSKNILSPTFSMFIFCVQHMYRLIIRSGRRLAQKLVPSNFDHYLIRICYARYE